LVVGFESEQIQYAVLSFSRFSEVEDRLFTVPLNALSLDSEQQQIVFNVDEQMLTNAPSLAQDEWPDAATPEWAIESRDYWQDQQNLGLGND